MNLESSNLFGTTTTSTEDRPRKSTEFDAVYFNLGGITPLVFKNAVESDYKSLTCKDSLVRASQVTSTSIQTIEFNSIEKLDDLLKGKKNNLGLFTIGVSLTLLERVADYQSELLKKLFSKVEDIQDIKTVLIVEVDQYDYGYAVQILNNLKRYLGYGIRVLVVGKNENYFESGFKTALREFTGYHQNFVLINNLFLSYEEWGIADLLINLDKKE